MRVVGDERPALRIEVLGKPEGGGPWTTRFLVTNEGVDAVGLLAAWMPHIVYRASQNDLSGQTLASGASTELTLDATYTPREDPSEPANPFLILRVLWRDEEWRVLVQLVVTGGPDGAPNVGIAVVNAHRVGFSTGLT